MKNSPDLNRRFLTFTPEVKAMMTKNNITDDMFWDEIINRAIEWPNGTRFHFFGKLFKIHTNSYGGPEVGFCYAGEST